MNFINKKDIITHIEGISNVEPAVPQGPNIMIFKLLQSNTMLFSFMVLQKAHDHAFTQI